VTSLYVTKKALGMALVVAGALMYFHSSAQAIPANQQSCSVDGSGGPNLFVIRAGGGDPADGDFVAIPGLRVTINNGSQPRVIVVHVTADVGVDMGAEVRIGYQIDGGRTQSLFGPQNFANNAQFFETRATFAVIPLGPGLHSIQVSMRVSGQAGQTAPIDDRCMTAEGRTS
jgi:hypothetical protein